MREEYFTEVRGAVVAKGLSLGKLAHELNITEKSLEQKLQGRKQFTLEEILKTCHYLEAEVDIFFAQQLHMMK